GMLLPHGSDNERLMTRSPVIKLGRLAAITENSTAILSKKSKVQLSLLSQVQDGGLGQQQQRRVHLQLLLHLKSSMFICVESVCGENSSQLACSAQAKNTKTKVHLKNLKKSIFSSFITH